MAQGLQYTTSITATSSGGGVAFTDPAGNVLKAKHVRINNTGSSDPVYINFTTTSGATTVDYPVKAGSSEAITIDAPPRAHYTGLSYTTTAAAAPPFRVLAWR